jgi:hypothetical protein
LDQVNDQHDDGYDDQKMNQTAADMHCEAKKPKYEQNNEYSPEHRLPFALNLYGLVAQRKDALISIFDSLFSCA